MKEEGLSHVLQVSCGLKHSVILGSDKEDMYAKSSVFTFGSSQNGRPGRGINSESEDAKARAKAKAKKEAEDEAQGIVQRQNNVNKSLEVTRYIYTLENKYIVMVSC